MGQVRFVQRAAVQAQLASGNLVLLTNIGVSSSGELLNCNAFDVSPGCWRGAWGLVEHGCVRGCASREGLGRASIGLGRGKCGRCRGIGGLKKTVLQPTLAPPSLPISPNTSRPSSPFTLPPPLLQVATHAAVELRADKLLLITGEDVRALGLPHYLPLVRGSGRGAHACVCVCVGRGRRTPPPRLACCPV